MKSLMILLLLIAGVAFLAYAYFDDDNEDTDLGVLAFYRDCLSAK